MTIIDTISHLNDSSPEEQYHIFESHFHIHDDVWETILDIHTFIKPYISTFKMLQTQYVFSDETFSFFNIFAPNEIPKLEHFSYYPKPLDDAPLHSYMLERILEGRYDYVNDYIRYWILVGDEPILQRLLRVVANIVDLPSMSKVKKTLWFEDGTISQLYGLFHLHIGEQLPQTFTLCIQEHVETTLII